MRQFAADPQAAVLATTAAAESGRLELSGRVSGIKAQNPINPAAATPARNRNAALYPAPTTMKPAAAALNAPPRPAAVAIAPWLTLKWPVPRVRSATTSGNNAPKIPAPTPSSNCTPTSQYGLSDQG